MPVFSKGREPAKLREVGVRDWVVDMKLPETLPSRWFQTQFQKRLGLQRFVDAKEAWDRLQQAGCDPSLLLASLEVYCSHVAAKKDARGAASYIQEFLKTNASLVAEAERLAIDLAENASRIEQLNRRPEIFRELTWREEGNPTLPDDVRSYAAWLKVTAGRIRSPFRLRDQPGQVIRFAFGYIKRMTGEDRLGDLTKLVRVGYEIVGNDEDVDANSLGKLVRRARHRLKKKIR